MHFSPGALLFALLPSTLAYNCVSSIALPWPAGGIVPSGSGSGTVGSGSSGSSTSACRTKCGNDSKCFQACLEVAQTGQCNAVGGSACSGSGSSVDLIGSGKGSGTGVDDLIKRATLECATSEVCYKYVDNSLLCVNLQSGNYHDDVGGRGNTGSGVYTSANGQVTTNAGDATGTKSPGATRTSTMRSSSVTTTSLVATGASTSRSVTAAAATSTSGAGGIKVDKVIGVIGLAVGLAL